MDGSENDGSSATCNAGEPLRRGLLQWTRMWDHFGVTTLPRPPAFVSERETQVAIGPPPDVSVGAVSVGVGSVGVEVDRNAALEILRHEIAECTRCNELAATRTRTVPGVGNPSARVCFLGEAPGADEDQQGEPFVGRAGQLLNRIIEACGMRREDVYIFNVLKCRPPGNRNPTPTEAEMCRPFLERQLQIICPEYIVCLGRIATSTLLETSQSMSDLRGKLHPWRDIKVLATYHPAYLLRNPSAKKLVWDDMKVLLADMGIAVPGTDPQRTEET